jgi:N6-L-threonylcarbamoyladenine synthase
MLILGIETSCDETAASVVKDGKQVLSHIVASSAEMHIKTGGIIPEQAAREQVKSVIPVIETALKEGCGWNVDNSSPPLIDVIAVTAGPGLIGSLLVGVETAKSLAFVWGKPLVPVNHLVAHLYANWLENDPPILPAISLVVSGGHTDIVLMHDHGKLEYLGGTRDDAAGEAFDKTARLLDLPYPGGPSISKAALEFKGEKEIAKLPRPLIYEDNFDFSFSGLKTHISREVQKYQDLSEVRNAFAFEVQEAITDVLVKKTLKAIEKHKLPTLLLAGGVAANSRLREKFKEEIEKSSLKVDFRVPEFKYCTDNASTIASYAEFNYAPLAWEKVTASPSLTIMDM